MPGRVRAAIFDLTGTLVRYSQGAYQAAVDEMARILTAQPFEFAQVWEGVMRGRELSADTTLEAGLDYALRTLNVYTHLDQRRAALDGLYQFERQVLIPEAESLYVLRRLRDNGVKNGLIANAAPVVARLWPESPLAPLIDAALFSCEAGLRKPDPRIYSLAARRLHVPSRVCIYISGGSEAELEGAEAAGMAAFRFDSPAPAQGDLSPRCDGRVLTSLSQVLEIAGIEAVDSA